MRIFTLIALLSWSFFNATMAQSPISAEDKARSYIQEKADEWQVEDIDLREMKLVDAYRGSVSGVYHMYYIQQWNGIEIYNAVTGIHLDENDEVGFAAPRVHGQLQSKIQDYEPAIEAKTAVKLAAGYLGVNNPETQLMASIENDVDGDILTFEPGNISERPIPARLVYQEAPDGQLRLAWDLSIDVLQHEDWMSMRVDAITGALLDENNWTVKCSFGDGHLHGKHCLEASEETWVSSAMPLADSASYRVYALPFENPLFGDRSVVTNPANPDASPFGWHDTDGVEGAEFTITRGNNTHAFPARDGSVSSDFDVDGGENLVFDFPLDNSLEPQDYTDASTANLFYVINMMHDIAYHYGFTEEAGNFQTTNYTGLGEGGDHVLGAAQFDGNSGQSINNATFGTPSDGGNGVMRMFEWNNASASTEFVTVVEPQILEGKYVAGTAEFGDQLSDDPVVGDVVIVDDGLQNPTDGCEEINNGDEVQGKIALIDRGECSFSLKVFNAQQKGAIAVIICNNQGTGVINMAGRENADLITIPSVFMSRSDCNQIRVAAGSDLRISLATPEESTGPERFDGSLDNGIIAHEYGHGISNRLTAGPSQSGCLANDEQMGEGWSDFFTVALTVTEDDDPADPRGIGAYVIREGKDGRGIRNFPYSTDLDVNPQTYEDVILSGTAPHPLGEIWNAMLWDLYWALVGEYGFDSDLMNGTGGNNIAIQLVMEGMALQACSPGFVDGRDAILAADEMLYNGDNQCLIWEVFARRGLGVDADQGRTDSRRDAKENFDTPIACLNDMFVRKSSTPNIEKGESFEVEIQLGNFTDEMLTDVIVTDLIPDGCSYISGSASIEPTINGDEMVFSIPEMAINEELNISYELQSDLSRASRWMEEQNFNETNEVTQEWIASSFEGEDPFRLMEEMGPDTSQAWFVPNTAVENDQFVFKFTGHDLTGEFPVLRFTHQYLTNPGTDGGIVEISTDGGNTFNDVEPLMFRGAYRGKLDFSTFAKVNQRAFWGDSEGFFTTYLDLRPFANEQNVFIRFRFGAQGVGQAEGWTIDDFHIFDAVTYETTVTVDYNGLSKTADPEQLGTIVEPDLSVSAENPVASQSLSVYPNPARDQIQLRLPKAGSSFEYFMYDMQGRTVQTGRSGGGQLVENIETAQLNSGIYILQLFQEDVVYQTKVVIQ